MFRAGRNRSNAPFRTAAVSRSAGLERVVERLRRRRHCARPGRISMRRRPSTHTENLREECIGADDAPARTALLCSVSRQTHGGRRFESSGPVEASCDLMRDRGVTF